jgi:2-polyprenyl-3-methyl-5-hydroxy-6-metoxy-1,4-benzoquinol methylase
MSEFGEVKKLFKKTISEILNTQGTNEALNESAFPAYANNNPVIDSLFWQRVEFSYNYLLKNSTKVIDFGCGSGILSYALAKKNIDITAFDIDLSPVNLVKTKISFPKNISFLEGGIQELEKIEENSCGAIAALDVFEHISDLDPYIKVFKKVLKPGGFIIASGPTENWLYKMGRKIAGKDYSGDYHETNIIDVRNNFEKTAEVKKLKIIYPLLPLFEIFTVRF